MNGSAIVQFPKFVAKNSFFFLWPFVTDVHIRRIIQIGSSGLQNVPFGSSKGIIEYFILSCLRVLPCLTFSCYLINICARFPGQLVVLRVFINRPPAGAVPLR